MVPVSEGASHPAHAAKSSRIRAACAAGDIQRLVDLATSEHGLISDELRRHAWPILLGCHERDSPAKISDWSSLPEHRDERQVKLDVDRSLVYYPDGESYIA